MNREKLLARDELGRQRAQEEFVHPIVLEAGAGTGKTATLVARVLAWSLGPGWEQVAAESETDEAEVIAQSVLRGIVAITFTEASAAEMSTRLGQALSHVARGDAQAVIGFKVELLDVSVDASGANDLHTTRARALLSNLDHLTVQTIHAFCRSLLATYPLEAKLHPDFVVDADGSRRRAVIRDILADAILTSYAREDPDALSHLATRGIGAAGLFEALDHLLAEGAEPDLFQADPFDVEGIDGLRRELIEVCQDLLAAGGASLRSTSARSKRTAEAITAIDATVELASVGGDSTPDPALLLESLRKLWGDGLAQRLRDWRSGRLNRSENDVFDGDPVQFAEAARRTRALIGSYERIDVVAFRYARRAIRDLLERATKELRAQGVATFAQLLSEAQRLLEETPAILKRERRQLDQLLVDEFQDTDPRQCSIVHKLALEGPEEERPGLFIVGDPKQSIYGWREADLEAYEEFVESVLESGGERHQLTTNFRSTPAVLAEVDRVMRPAMTAENGLQPSYEPLVPFEKDTPSKTETPETEAAGDPDGEQQADIEHWIAWTGFDRNPKGRSEEIADLEARSVAADIERYRARSGASWRDCAVLYRGRGQLEAFQNALRARGIPYAVSRDVGYYRRREVVEAAALVRTVLNPADHLALVTWLRCSAVGVPDAALLPLWQKKLPDLVGRLSGPDDPTLERLTQVAREAAEETPEDVPGIDRIEGWESNLIAGFEFLATARELARTLPADHFVEALRQRSLFEVGESARYQGEYRLANLERFFRQLESALGDPRLEIEGVLHTLRSNIQVQPDAEEAKPQGPEEDSVQLMTIHVAKGLEFRAVWVVQLHAAQRSFDRGIEAAKFDRRQGKSERSPAYSLFGWPTPDFHRSEERERRVEEAERVRTLYVAMTRARERLVLSGSWPTGDGPNHWRDARSQVQLLQMRQPGVPKLDELWNDLSSGNGDRLVDPEGVQWRFPALDRSTGDVRSRTDDRPAPSIERWRAEAAAYRVSSEAADERSRRSSHAPASSFHGELEDHNTGSEAADREAALLAGTVIHAAFERWRFGEPTADELVRAREFATNESDRAPHAIADRVRRRIELLFDRLDSSSSIDRLQSFRDTWHAREVPVISPPPDVSVPQPPLAAMTGSIDLLYLDEAEDRFVIVDYKTDLVEGEAAVEERAAAYRPQLEAYRSAIAGALPRDRPPRCELWFVWDDRIVVFE